MRGLIEKGIGERNMVGDDRWGHLLRLLALGGGDGRLARYINGLKGMEWSGDLSGGFCRQCHIADFRASGRLGFVSSRTLEMQRLWCCI